MWLAQEVIRRKRDGGVLDADDIRRFVASISDSSLSEGQVAAFAMAVLLKGMNIEERIALTAAMRDSGQVLHWDLPGPVVDKHSTGGVGDMISLPLAPLLAACGCFVPMISGRGLGHTGGTLDKLESIPGYDCQPSLERFRQIVAEVGCAIIGQTADLAPADKRLYAIRDMTGTVESLDLITASILSKKLAAGLDVLVMDVKTGNGAFMAQAEDAAELARSIADVANGAGVRTTALVTDMNQPLARSAGNGLEVAEAVALLQGEVRSPRLWELTLSLAEQALMLAGPQDFIHSPQHYLPAAAFSRPVWAEHSGTVSAVDTRAVGMAVVELGGGRRRPQDQVDPAVGFSELRFIGEQVDDTQPLGWVHGQTADAVERATLALQAAYRIGAAAQISTPLVAERIVALRP
jgi:thymidine phosphorylase